jgi:hypothetical protein
LINTNRATVIHAEVEVDGRSLGADGDLYHYRPQGDATNGGVVGPEAARELGSSFTIGVAPYSATTLRIPIAE